MTNNLTNSALEEPKHWFYCDIRHVSHGEIHEDFDGRAFTLKIGPLLFQFVVALREPVQKQTFPN